MYVCVYITIYTYIYIAYMGGWGANSPMFRQLLRTGFPVHGWWLWYFSIYGIDWDSIIPELIINQQGSWTPLMSIYPYEHFKQNDAYFSGVKPALSQSQKDSWRSAFLGSEKSSVAPLQQHPAQNSPMILAIPNCPNDSTTSWGIAVTEERSRARPTFWMSTPSMVTEPSVGSTVRRRILQRNVTRLFGQVGGPTCSKNILKAQKVRQKVGLHHNKTGVFRYLFITSDSPNTKIILFWWRSSVVCTRRWI